MNTMNKFIKIVLLGSLLVLAGCNAVENLSNSGTRLIISAIKGVTDGTTTESDVIMSDVLLNGSIVNTNAVLYLNAALLNPDATADDISHYNNVIVDRIDVNFTRTDGRNEPLVDVPLSFSVPVSQQITVGTQSKLSFILVRHTAKMEPPLRDLRELGQEHVLVLVANITVYSYDLAGNRLEPVSGWVEVHCADFADPKEEPDK